MSSINGTDYRPFEYSEKMSFFFQPGIAAGLELKDWIYVGVFASKYCCFVYNDAHGHERDIIGVDVGYPFGKTHTIGISVGREKYRVPWFGPYPSEYKYQSVLWGIFYDYKVNNYLSLPSKLSLTNDKDSEIGPFWHFSLGISGSLPIL